MTTPQERHERLKRAILEADAEFERGEGITLTPELMEELKRRSEQMVRDGVALDPDFVPFDLPST